MAVLKKFACFLGFDPYSDYKSKRKKIRGNDLRVAGSAVRIIHPGGCEEWHQNEILARKLMEDYPGMCVARPGVFENPHESVLSGDERLVFGNKYYLVPSTTVKKLKRRHGGEKKRDEARDLLLANDSSGGLSDDFSEGSICSAKDFYVSKEKWGKCTKNKKNKKGKKAFVPPIQKPKMWRKLEWEPSLDSIKEISP